MRTEKEQNQIAGRKKIDRKGRKTERTEIVLLIAKGGGNLYKLVIRSTSFSACKQGEE